jgi:hypothetical protein
MFNLALKYPFSLKIRFENPYQNRLGTLRLQAFGAGASRNQVLK